MSDCKCKVGPGKFEGEPVETFIAYGWGVGDDTIWDGEEPTECFRGPLVASIEDAREAREYGYCDACIKSAFAGVASIAVWEDSQGFVYSKAFDTVEEYDEAIAADLAAVSETEE